MSKENDELYVRVRDMAGNEFVCPITSLKKPDQMSEEDLENCVDDGTVGRYAGNIKIAE